MSDDSGAGIRRIGEAVAAAAIVVGIVMGFLVVMAWGGGYPGFNGRWLLHVVLPAYVVETAIVAVFWARWDIKELVQHA